MNQWLAPSRINLLKAVSQICEPYVGAVLGSVGLDNFTDSSIVELLTEVSTSKV